VWNVGAFGLDTEGAARVARLMTDPQRSRDSRALGHINIAWTEVARGRWGAAQRELDSAAQFRPGWALEHRALLSLHPVALEAPRDQLQRALRAWDARAEPPAVQPTSFFSADEELHEIIRLYLLGRLAAAVADPAANRWGDELAGTSAPSSAAALPQDMASAIRAYLANAQGDDDGALRELGPARPHALYQTAISSPFASLPSERFLRATLLEGTRPDEALHWYSSFAGVSHYDVAFLAPAEYRRGVILEEQGRVREAAAAFRRFLDLWHDCDPGLGDQVRDAEARLSALDGTERG